MSSGLGLSFEWCRKLATGGDEALFPESVCLKVGIPQRSMFVELSGSVTQGEDMSEVWSLSARSVNIYS